MKKEHIFSVAVLLVLWAIAAASVGNDILIPYPMDTMKRFAMFFVSPSFYEAVGSTVLRVFRGFILSLGLALITCILAERSETFRHLFAPVQIITRTIPNISYMILALIWLGSEGAVSAVSFMILFPVFYNAFSSCLENEDPVLRDVDLLYPETFGMRLKTRIVPMLVPEILRTGKTAAGLGLKVGIMAEILGQVRTGIGRSMNFARLNLDTTGILAWTLVIILISVLSDGIFDWLLTEKSKEEQ
ncbi:MAG: ABC transporter permease [Solobacterium sp.]|nr:ABC transporter permease [Solobacterium sp.]